MSDTQPPLPAQAAPHSILVKRAFAAIEAATTVSDLKRIAREWTAIAAYASRAKAFRIQADAAEIRARAERRLGQMMAEQKSTVGLNKGGRPKTGVSETPVSAKPTLAEAGIDKNMAKRAREQAAKSPERFERDIAETKINIIDPRPKPKPVVIAMPGLADQCMQAVRSRISDTVREMRRQDSPRSELEMLFAGLQDVIADLEREGLAADGEGAPAIGIPEDLGIPSFLDRRPKTPEAKKIAAIDAGER